ncbi:MAG: transglutaminase protein, partial [Bacilli bacterium]|nr:transglutaminase protein [Bacilli bacterium]
MIRDWLNLLKAVLWGLFWLPTLWVAADYHLIQSNGLEINLLLVTVLIQVVPLKHRLINNLLQLTAALAVLLSFHSIELIISGKWMLLVMQVIRTVLVLSLYFSTLQWITTRWRMLICFLITIVVYGVLDSFGSKLVWDKAALIIFAGLCLLVLQQLEEIRLRRPNVWSYLSEYPGSLGAPIAILICITMVFGMLAPSLPSVISIGGAGPGHSGAVSHQQSGSSDSSLSTSSGYSRDDKQLGSGFQFDYTQVIQVDTTQASYLRGETRSFYTGQGWELSKSEQQAPVSSVDADQPLSSDVQLDSSRLQTVDVNQTVTMLTPIIYPVMFGAYSISRVSPVQSDPPINLAALHWSAYQAELRFNRQNNESFPNSYTVVSKVPIVDEAALRSVVKQPDPAFMQDDLQLPAKLPNRVKQLAVTITQNQSTYYDKVKSIEQYLSSHYTYNNLPVPPAPGQDFVDHFLFESKQGYCDHFSTAMVILARSLGIPARWVKGYTAGAV